MAGKALANLPKRASLRRAEKIVDSYKIVIEPTGTLGYVGSAVEMPTGFGSGTTREECLRETRDILRVLVATMIDLGGAPPRSGARQRRTAQVNVRVSRTEKDLMQKAAAHLGFKGIGDFMRTKTMEAAQSVFKNL